MQPDGSTSSTLTQPAPELRLEPGQTLTFQRPEDATLTHQSSSASGASTGHSSDQFDNFTIIEEISGGGTGTVFKAKDRLGRLWAIKILRDDRLSEDMCKRFFVEAQQMQALKHDNLLQIQDYRIFEGRPFLILPLCKGSFVDRILSGNLSVRESVRLMMQATKGLGYLHEQGYVHRDIKPGNLLIDQEGKAIVADLGLLQERHETSVDPNTPTTAVFVPGTIPYMKPEVLAGVETSANPSWDIHACGVTLYQMLSGKRPPICSSPVDYLDKSREEAVPALSTENKKVPKALDNIIARCCAKEGGYANATQLNKALRGWYYRWHTRSLIAFIVLLFCTGFGFAAMTPAKPKIVPQPSMLEVLEKNGEVTLIDGEGKAIYPPQMLLSKRATFEVDQKYSAYSIQAFEPVFVQLADKLSEGVYQIEGDMQITSTANTAVKFVTGFQSQPLGNEEDAYLFRSFLISEGRPEYEGSIRAASQLNYFTNVNTIHTFGVEHRPTQRTLPKTALQSWHSFTAVLDGTHSEFSIDGVQPSRIANIINDTDMKEITKELPFSPFPPTYTFGNDRPIGFILFSGEIALKNVKIIRKK